MIDDFVARVRDQIGAIATSLTVIFFTGLIFWQTNLEIRASLQTTQALLNSLAITQSSAVAIIASVTLLNVQLVADRYSTELVRSSLRSSPFNTVLFVFIASIAFDLILVYNIEHHGTVGFTIAVVAAAAWALINAYVLYDFIFNSVGVLTPSSLITTITKHEPKEIADRTTPLRDISSEAAPSDSDDQEEPLYQLYVIISSSVGAIDYYVVQKGLRELRSLLEETIRNLEQPAGTKLCRKAFRYYPRIVDQCLKSGEIEQAEHAVRDLTALLETLETEADGWHRAHFAGIQGLFEIYDGTTDVALIDNETISARLEHRPSSYWTADRLEYVLTHAEAEIDRAGSQSLSQELISLTHASVIDGEQTVEHETEPVTLWEQEMEDVLTSVVLTHRETEPQASQQFLELWPQLYQRPMSGRWSHREWLVTVIFELAVFHAAHHTGEYDTGKDALLNTLRGAQPKHTRERIKTLQALTQRQTRHRREVTIVNIADEKGYTETAYQYRNLAENMVSEAIDAYRQQNWNTEKAIEFIRAQPRVISDHIDSYRFIKPPAEAEYTLITDPEAADGQIIKLVIAEEINSDLIDSLSLDGISRYLCIGPLVTGDFTAPDIETTEQSLPELRPPSQASIYDYYDWS